MANCQKLEIRFSNMSFDVSAMRIISNQLNEKRGH